MISLPQLTAIILLIIAVLIPSALWGNAFAVRVKERPFRKTWHEVAVGVGSSEFAVFLLSEGTFWILGILSLAWWIPILYPILVYAIAGGCQIWRQEQKISYQRMRSKTIKALDDLE